MLNPTNTAVAEMLNSPVRTIKARVELYEGSTLFDTFTYQDRLISFTVDRIGDSNKFFGYGVCQKINVKLIDTNRELNITTANRLVIAFGVGNDYMYTMPQFYVTEVHRDENTNQLSVTAYDAIYAAAAHTTEEVELSSFTIGEYAAACAALIGVSATGIDAAAFNTEYEAGANLDGTETIRAALDAIAEVTQTIYYINSNNVLAFKRLDIAGDAVLTIDKSKYITLQSSTNRRLNAVCHATELGDNVIASLDISGTTQYIRNNPFWEMREDIGELVDNALAAVGGLTINQFDCSWRGNFLLEIGDKISLVTKDNDIVHSYFVDDVLTYNGTLSQKTKWSYTGSDAASANNPTSLGETLKQTFARVDKANKQIEMVVSESKANSENISSILLDTKSINATIQQMESSNSNSFESVNEDIAALNNRVSATMTAEEVSIAIHKEMANGANKVVTATGYTFDESGLSVSKTDSEMKTTISEDGMKVFKNDSAVLTANNVGVEAVNLHAKTYLIIGTNSRFEDYGNNRTGCFWIGGNE